MEFKAIGDLSPADRVRLRELAEASPRILEAGVGASTQILTHYSPGSVLTYDTDPKWVERVRDVLFPQVGVKGRCQFLKYEAGTTKLIGKYDLVFVDLAWELRLEFALKAWPRLVPGGRLVFHDARRTKDMILFSQFLNVNYREIASVDICFQESNLIEFIKREKRIDYENWHEGLTDEQLGIEWLK